MAGDILGGIGGPLPLK